VVAAEEKERSEVGMGSAEEPPCSVASDSPGMGKGRFECLGRVLYFLIGLPYR
jgi:hypothetical protein